MTTTKSLHTLNARDYALLEVARDYFKLSPEQMFHEIQRLRYIAEDVLNRKGISYGKLRSALVPAQDRREIALVFDRKAIDESWYGLGVMQVVLPLFERKSSHSVLMGDYLAATTSSRQRAEPSLPIAEWPVSIWSPRSASL